MGLKHDPGLLVALARHLRGHAAAAVVVISEGRGADWLAARKREEGLDNLSILPFQPYDVMPEVAVGGERTDPRSSQAVADEVCQLALGGQFRWARLVAYPYDVYVPMTLLDDLELLDECPAWVAFEEVVDLAERIDSFLAVVQSDRRTAALAQDCRGELDLMGVLADLCEDLEQPRAAAEARHLHGLLRWA